MSALQSSYNDIMKTMNDPITAAGFRIQHTRLHLTYKTHIKPEEYMKWLETLLSNTNIVHYSIVNETSNDGYEHTHVLFETDKKIMTRDPRKFDYTEIHPNIKLVTTIAHWKNIVKYHHKQGTPMSNVTHLPDEKKENVVEEIWSHSSVQDALIHTVKSIKQVGGTIAAFDMKPIDYGDEPEVAWRPWQQALLDEV
jgi:hypothetical protein